MDVIVTPIYTIGIFRKDNYERKLSGIERLVERRVPSSLQDRYKEELLSLGCLFGKLFHRFPNREFRLTLLNSNYMEDLGAKLAQSVHLGAEEGFDKFPAALADPKEAASFMATLATIFVQGIHKVLKETHMKMANLLTDEDDEKPGPSKRMKAN
ncbi:uncharacterized protein [Drosophila bipectinata]|uniref:uncharacterized protein n=1 Tax=Drosophila bipectinata TaxID=42026 RepID=UPI0038B3A6D4